MKHEAARRDAVRCALAAIAASDPFALVTGALDRHALGARIDMIAVGKAAPRMAAAAIDALGARIGRGVIVATDAVSFDDARVALYRGGHPIPSAESVRAAEAVLRLADSLQPGVELLCLISGGASSLLALPPDGVTLDDLRVLTQLLLQSGASIDEVNCVRKHLDQLKGGRLAVRAFPARVLTLALSDVIGDSLASISSGPTVPDPTTSADAISVLRARGVWNRVPRIDLQSSGGRSLRVAETRRSTLRQLARGSDRQQ